MDKELDKINSRLDRIEEILYELLSISDHAGSWDDAINHNRTLRNDFIKWYEEG